MFTATEPDDTDPPATLVARPLTPEEHDLLSRYDTQPNREAIEVAQPQAIAGYRQLAPEELALINEGKALARQLHDFILKLRMYPAPPRPLVAALFQPEEPQVAVDPRWVAIGETHLQQGFMALTRAIAKPTEW